MFAVREARGKSGLSTHTMYAMPAAGRAWQIMAGKCNV